MFERSIVTTLVDRLGSERRFVQALVGPRQVGKTTAVLQAGRRLEASGLGFVFASGDEPLLPGPAWIDEQWEVARAASSGGPVILALDEIHKLSGWADRVKANWDRDTRSGADVRLVVLGSSPLLVGRRLGESLAGRFEIVPATHWQWDECREAFGWDVDTFVFHGGYPGAAPLVGDFPRWRRYVLDALIETTVSRDVLSLGRIEKPALLRQLFYLTCELSGQVVAYSKLLGQLHDAGNTTTLAHYLRLLEDVWLAAGVQKYSGSLVRKRSSSPKLLVLDTALMSAVKGIPLDEARRDKQYWGRLVETAVGARLLAQAQIAPRRVMYWRERDLEVDFVLADAQGLTAIEVKSGRERDGDRRGLDAFVTRSPSARVRMVGSGGTPLDKFLAE
ncbi:MAG: ATP-binding protein [Actinomycetes bacterium]